MADAIQRRLREHGRVVGSKRGIVSFGLAKRREVRDRRIAKRVKEELSRSS